MDIWHNIILATIQGITEFLPVSSSAHLILIPYFFGWPDQGLDFDIVLHLGTLTAILIYFRNELTKLINPFYSLTQNVILATIPVCIAGLLFKSHIEIYSRSIGIIAFTTIIFGLLLGYAQTREIPYAKNPIKHLAQINYKYALIIGLFQCIAIVPGTSRSGITLTAALLLGLPRHIAAQFSFLLSIPVISLSGILVIKDIIKQPSLATFDLSAYIIGFLVSAIIALISINLFMKLINKIGMLPFVIYRVLLGIFLLCFYVTN
jgi:undecaprenyl-diphosphatase